MYQTKSEHSFFITIHPDNKHQFEKENYKLLISQIKIIAISFLLLAAYFFYSDLQIFKNITNVIYVNTLMSIHFAGLVSAILFLIVYHKIKDNFNKRNINILRVFITIFLILGTFASLNSQRLTGNIDAYIIFTILASMAFTYEPFFMFIALLVNYLILCAGMHYICENDYFVIIKQINASAVFVTSILLCYSLYQHRVNEFLSNCKLMKSEANLLKLFNVNPVPLIISRFEDGKIVMANQKAYDFYGYSEQEFLNLPAKKLYKTEENRENILGKLKESNVINNYAIEHTDKLGLTKWVIANTELFKFNDENCLLTSVTDITEIKKLESKLLDHASTDVLTSAFNRRKGLELLNSQVSISKQNQSSLVICFIDIDGLKYVNDNFGHSEGDYLIQRISTTIRENIRGTDIFFRYGGDEFIILFPNKNKNFVESIWTRITQELNILNSKKIKPYEFSISHGLFEYKGDPSLTVNEILTIADKNMYLEKTAKKANRT